MYAYNYLYQSVFNRINNCMILKIDTPRNYNITDVLKRYHVFSLDMIDKYGMDYLVASNTIVLCGNWDNHIDKTIDHNVIVVNWEGNKFIRREHISHDPFYCTFSTFYKISLWHKYIAKYDHLTQGSWNNDLSKNWFTHFSFHCGINIRNIKV